VGNRNPSNKGFDPSSFDDVLELVGRWTAEGSTTAAEIVERLRARGVVVRATSSGRHAIVESARCCAGERSEARLLVVPTPTPHQERTAPEPRRDRTPRQHVIRPPGQALHRVAAFFGKRTRERILDPIIADMQLEYCEALAEQRPRKLMLWVIQLRAWVAFIEAILLKTVVGRLAGGLSRLILPRAGGAGPGG
jgi:hypothetical protein